MKAHSDLRQHLVVLSVLALFVTVLYVSCIYLWPIQTVDAVSKIAVASKGLTLSPLRTEINISPGTSFSGSLKVTNSTAKQMTVGFSAEEFKVTDAQYDYEFIAESDVARWATFIPSEISLKEGESKKIKFTVGAPLTAELGGYYISMFAGTSVGSPNDAGNSQERVASLLYITVASDVLGAVTRAGHVLSLSSPWLVVNGGTWGMTLQDAGTTHFRSNYTVSVDNLFGGTAASSQGSALILPNTVRAISEALPLPYVPGIYKVVYKIGLGDTPDAVETRYMLYLPPWAVLTVTTVIVVAGYLLFRKLNKKR